MTDRYTRPLLVLAMTFVTMLLVANILAVKLVDLYSWVMPAGIIVYPLTFALTDTVSETYGRKYASMIVWLGFAMSLAMVVLLQIGQHAPAASFWQGQDAYEQILGAVPRIVLASMVAYLVSQNHDVFAFHLISRLTKGRHLWLRNNASTMVSQALDTVLFVSIAFAGTVPSGVLWNIMITQYVLKLIIAALDTPFVYILVGVVRWYQGNQVIGEMARAEIG